MVPLSASFALLVVTVFTKRSWSLDSKAPQVCSHRVLVWTGKATFWRLVPISGQLVAMTAKTSHFWLAHVCYSPSAQLTGSQHELLYTMVFSCPPAVGHIRLAIFVARALCHRVLGSPILSPHYNPLQLCVHWWNHISHKANFIAFTVSTYNIFPSNKLSSDCGGAAQISIKHILPGW